MKGLLFNKLFLVSLMSVALAACGDSSDNGGGGGGSSGKPAFSGTYSFEANGCKTGLQSYTSRQELCRKLTDEALNKHCAQDLRKIEFTNSCEGMTWPGSGADKKPVPAPAPGCYNAAAHAPKGTEVPLETLIDGLGGFYRMTAAHGLVKYKEGDKEISAAVAVTAGTNADLENPKTTEAIACKSMEQGPEGSLEGYFHQPVAIQRENGSLSGNINGVFKAYGPSAGASDRITTSVGRQAKWTSLWNLRQDLAKSGMQVRIFQINSTTFQMLATGKQENGSRAYEILISAIYIYQAPTSQPIPDPTPGPGPAPAPAPQDLTSPEAMAAVCNEYTYTDHKIACLRKMHGKAILIALLNICKEYTYTDHKVACMEKMAGVNVPKPVIATCNEYTYTDHKVNCVLKFKP